ncbi:MAG: hypothetical protein KGL53_08235 [Elusimicrobia bacterium]|nr:hypothetical protein [Elusimicrobiota bacterium]
MDGKLIARWLRETTIVRAPKHLLSTFGATRIDYHLVSPIEGLAGKTRLREGQVLSEKPQILTAEALRERFEGFGPEGEQFREFIDARYGDVLRSLEYRFRNADPRTTLLSSDPRDAAERIKQDVDARDVAQAAVIACPDPAWPLALMSFTLEEAKRSFPSNVRDLETRGRFDPDSGAGRRRRAEVEAMFERAARDSGARSLLGAKLREYGLFEEYEDRFLGLFS